MFQRLHSALQGPELRVGAIYSSFWFIEGAIGFDVYRNGANHRGATGSCTRPLPCARSRTSRCPIPRWLLGPFQRHLHRSGCCHPGAAGHRVEAWSDGHAGHEGLRHSRSEGKYWLPLRIGCPEAEGYLTLGYYMFPGFFTQALSLKVSEVPNGFAALSKGPCFGCVPISLRLGPLRAPSASIFA